MIGSGVPIWTLDACTLSSLLPTMSLKVPKAQNLQLFKDGYKVSTSIFPFEIYLSSPCPYSTLRALKMPCYGISKPWQSYPIS